MKQKKLRKIQKTAINRAGDCSPPRFYTAGFVSAWADGLRRSKTIKIRGPVLASFLEYLVSKGDTETGRKVLAEAAFRLLSPEM